MWGFEGNVDIERTILLKFDLVEARSGVVSNMLLCGVVKDFRRSSTAYVFLEELGRDLRHDMTSFTCMAQAQG